MKSFSSAATTPLYKSMLACMRGGT